VKSSFFSPKPQINVIPLSNSNSFATSNIFRYGFIGFDGHIFLCSSLSTVSIDPTTPLMYGLYFSRLVLLVAPMFIHIFFPRTVCNFCRTS
jgi:hypothetical protein